MCTIHLPVVVTFFFIFQRIPHTLVWAKLKGYPFWPGKVVKITFVLIDEFHAGTQ